MQISVRSYLTMGTAAVVGAGAIALTPTIPAGPVAAAPTPVVAQVTLTAFSFSDILGTLQNFGLGAAIPSNIINLVPTNFVDAVVGEFVNEAGGLISGTASTVFNYVTGALAGLISGPDSIPGRFGTALANIPTVLATAFQALSTGDLPTALQALGTGLLAPLTAVGQAIADAGKALQDFVGAQVNALVTGLPGVLFNSISAIVGGNLQSVLDSVRTALSGLLGGIVPGLAAAPLAAAASAPAALAAPVTAPRLASVITTPALAAAKATPRAAASVSLDDVATQQDSSSQQTLDEAPKAPRSRGALPRAVVADSAAGDSVASAKPVGHPRSAAAKAPRSQAGNSQQAGAAG